MRFREVERNFSNQGVMKKEISGQNKKEEEFKKIKPEGNITKKDADAFWNDMFSGDEITDDKIQKVRDKYNKIVESLQERINSGDITLEFAEAVNDLAYEKYISESSVEDIMKQAEEKMKNSRIKMLDDTVKFAKEDIARQKEFYKNNPQIIEKFIKQHEDHIKKMQKMYGIDDYTFTL